MGLIFCFSVHADTITFGGETASSSITSPTLTGYGDSKFTYYGFPTTNYGTSFSYSAGISSTSELHKFPPQQLTFTLTGTNFEVYCLGYDPLSASDGQGITFTINDGTQTTSYTNAWAGHAGITGYRYVMVNFGSNIIHNITMAISGGFGGINTGAGNSIAQRILSPKPNLLIIEGDSYTEGYNPTVQYGYMNSYSSWWFDGWAWQLAQLVTNTICIPSGVSGTGYASGPPTYFQRVIADICTTYTNAVASGKYNNIFVFPSGTINDESYPEYIPTNSLNLYWTLKTNCPLAYVCVVGNWYGYGGSSSPSVGALANNMTLSNSAYLTGLPYFSPIAANLVNAGNYNTFFPPGSTTDSVHPGRVGYGIMANWVNTNLVNTFGTNWNAGGIPISTNYGGSFTGTFTGTIRFN